MGFGGGSGGGSIGTATDVALNSPTNGQVLTYNSSVAKWQNQAGGASAVTSVAGRTGAVVLAESDITNLTTDLAAKAAVGSTAALALGSASAGSSTSAARQDHVHPTTGLLLTSQQTSIKAVVVYSSGYAARPSGYGSVEWIGPVDPGASALANDTWINTA